MIRSTQRQKSIRCPHTGREVDYQIDMVGKGILPATIAMDKDRIAADSLTMKILEDAKLPETHELKKP